MCAQPKKVGRGKKPAKAPSSSSGKSSSKKKDWRSQHGHLFPKAARDFGPGKDVLPKKRDLSRYVRWPRYVRIQRQKAILKKRLKVPPGLNQFTKTLNKNQGSCRCCFVLVMGNVVDDVLCVHYESLALRM